MSTEKLPERPEKPSPHAHMVEHCQYWMGMSDFYRARMEALVGYAQHTGAWCGQDMGHSCTCGLSELLAACARKEAGR